MSQREFLSKSQMSTSQKIFTLAMVRKTNALLLGLKKKGFGEGKWNGFGGKVEKDETISEGAVRELEEESGLVAKCLTKIGILEFEFVGDPVLFEVHVFDVTQYEGEPVETEEMKPQWFPEDGIPYEKMWPDDILWYPLYLKGIKFRGHFLYQGYDTILNYTLTQMDHLPS
ncbi:7,8-dihydro-8-oxoguanine triphosphatase isoform X2 [Cryptotermes secundus]|uniref:7,8-dihydro-8-oxoguanine triphosphatase isoform X2 n=1 Tax=Cryptotermes secundus TaxID=105785 RepID=UPI000CD7C7D6|nr:7,8-dihydro-8-oxoguanine triphosphatase isoform X2 [Cryptotermes secundus]